VLLEENDKRIEDLRREAETLRIFTHYFKSIEHRRLEQPAEETRARRPGACHKASQGARQKAHGKRRGSPD
jgi:hypothetical protein